MEISERDESTSEKRNAPTVSREKWRVHAIGKLSKGYVIIVGDKRRNANFYQPGKGYEMCAYNVATQLIKEGVVVPSYEHHLGMAYALAEAPPPPPPSVKPPPVDDDDDDDVAVDDLESLLNDLSEGDDEVDVDEDEL